MTGSLRQKSYKISPNRINCFIYKDFCLFSDFSEGNRNAEVKYPVVSVNCKNILLQLNIKGI